MLDEHREREHNEVKCDLCGNMSLNMATSRIHTLIHRAEINKKHSSYYPGQSNNFKCTPCKRAFQSNKDLKYHLSEGHQSEQQQAPQVVTPQFSFAQMAASPGGQEHSRQGGQQQQQQNLQGGNQQSFQGVQQQSNQGRQQQSFQVNFQGGHQQQQSSYGRRCYIFQKIPD